MLVLQSCALKCSLSQGGISDQVYMHADMGRQDPTGASGNWSTFTRKVKILPIKRIILNRRRRINSKRWNIGNCKFNFSRIKSLKMSERNFDLDFEENESVADPNYTSIHMVVLDVK